MAEKSAQSVKHKVRHGSSASAPLPPTSAKMRGFRIGIREDEKSGHYELITVLSGRNSPVDQVEISRKGVPATLIDEFANQLGISRAQFLSALDLKPSTIERRVARNLLLTTTETDRLYRVEKVLTRATEVLEDAEAAKAWLQREIRSLGGVTPLSLLDTDPGVDMVMDTLGRIEQGIAA